MAPRDSPSKSNLVRSYEINDERASSTSSSSTRLVEVGQCAIQEVGLENFIRRIIKELNLTMKEDDDDDDDDVDHENGQSRTPSVVFNLNHMGILHGWKKVFEVERVYSTCLGISKRLYQCHGYTREPLERRTYFILEEFNQRMYPWILPDFSYYVMVFCYYDTNHVVTKVEVQYDQMRFFLHCLGLAQLHSWCIAHIMTPCAYLWMRLYRATGLIHPLTFLAQLFLFPYAIYYCYYNFFDASETP
jgi:hypothetical protein